MRDDDWCYVNLVDPEMLWPVTIPVIELEGDFSSVEEALLMLLELPHGTDQAMGDAKECGAQDDDWLTVRAFAIFWYGWKVFILACMLMLFLCCQQW